MRFLRVSIFSVFCFNAWCQTYPQKVGMTSVLSLSALATVVSYFPVPSSASFSFDTFLEESINANLVWQDRALAGSLSDVALYVVFPLIALKMVNQNTMSLKEFTSETCMILNSILINYLSTELLKRSSGRARPEQLWGYSEAQEEQAYSSFPSGHASAAFAVAASMFYVTPSAQERAFLLGLGGMIGYLRVAAAKHWISDVGVGAALGGLVGVIFPYWLQRPHSTRKI